MQSIEKKNLVGLTKRFIPPPVDNGFLFIIIVIIIVCSVLTQGQSVRPISHY